MWWGPRDPLVLKRWTPCVCKTSCFGSQGTWQPRLRPLAAPCSTPEPFPRGSSTPRRSPSQVRRALLPFCRRLAGSQAASFPRPRSPRSIPPGSLLYNRLLPELLSRYPGPWQQRVEGPPRTDAAKRAPLSLRCACAWAGEARPPCPSAICGAESGSAPRAWLRLRGKLEPFVVLGLNAFRCG